MRLLHGKVEGILKFHTSKNRTTLGILAALSGISIAGYLLASLLVHGIGFPLDDAWIHQTYARNLAQFGEWAFLPGQPSAGSTSPLWSVLLAIGHYLNVGPFIWTFCLGWFILSALAFAAVKGSTRFFPALERKAFWIGVFLIFEWHLVWAACSGMETLLFSLLILMSLSVMARTPLNGFGLGIIIGLSTWVRPDGITLVGPALLCIFLIERDWGTRIKSALFLTLGFLALFLPYLSFNKVLSGSVWPNTFFAKQAEYTEHLQFPLWERVAAQFQIPVVGAGGLLIPGFVMINIQAVRRRNWVGVAGSLWFLGYLILYALRLPVTYQHGRYVIPALPIYFIWSLAGFGYWVQLDSPQFWRRVIGKAWLLSISLVWVVFWFLGARAYGRDVAVINTEMVAISRWLAENSEPEALVAAHDIGALGYFGERAMLDLAGLVSPEVIPFIRDEKKLEKFIDEVGADYLVTFPGWYPHLVQRGKQVYCSMGAFSPAMGGENMCVYKWQHP